MKKYLALLLAVVFTVSLFAACGGNNQNGDNNASANNNQSGNNESQKPELSVDLEQPQTWTHHGFGITLPCHFVPNSKNEWFSDEEDTTIYASYISFSVIEDSWGVAPGSLEDMTKTYVENEHIEGELLKGDGDYYYIVTEDETGEGPWTRMLAFYICDEEFWEVNFYSYSRSWADVEEQWTSYIETIQFN